ncbi:MAG TPA: hypothetical protein VFQ91_03980 [Bryobacteraceae bacterium]|nr:hypothetical protein [Bryobacteraceae bacterium]
MPTGRPPLPLPVISPFRTLPVLAVLACAPALLAAGEADRCVSSLLPAALSPCAHADLDGDRRTDLALTFRRSLTITLSTTQEQQVFDLAAYPMASGVLSHDIDGDHDKDLIVTAGFQMPVAVFVNDGAGRFSAGKLPSSLTFDGPAPEIHSGEFEPLALTTASVPAPLLPPPPVQTAALAATAAAPRPVDKPAGPRAVRPPPIRAP